MESGATARPAYLGVPLYTAFGKCLLRPMFVLYVLSSRDCIVWNSVSVMVVTAMRYVTIVRRILLYAR